eukprot:scaffold2587_cov101-Cylindrotheca_fusiformis.AAC.1
MKFSSFAAFCAPLLLVHSQEVQSQESSFFLRQGRNADVVKPSLSLSLSSPQGKEVNAVSLQKSNHDFEDATPTSNHHRLLAADSFWQEVKSFPQLDGAFGGYRVSLSGEGTFLASAPYSYSANSNAGIVQFFQKQTGGTWEEIADLRLEGNSTEDYFGSAVSLSNDGKRVAIGALADDGGDGEVKTDSGSVSVYDIDDSTGKWKELQVIHGENADDQSGTSVALSKDGKTLAIGAPLNDGNGTYSGHVRVYRKADGDNLFTQIGDDIDGEAASEYFGDSVALSKDGMVLAVGAPLGKNSAGRVRVFEWDKVGTSWEQRGSNIDGNAESDIFGRSVDLSDDGNILAVGAKDGGYAKVFEWNGDSWQSIDNDALSYLIGNIVYSVSLATPPSDSIILAVATKSGVDTYKLNQDGEGNQLWELLLTDEKIPGSIVSLSSNGKTLAVGDQYGDGAVTVHKALSSTSSGSNGDPHFRTWNGGHFEYHGQCDMILVQIRTKLVKFWSFIQNAAIRIGDDVLEIQGSPDLSVNKGNNHYWINSIYQGQVTTLGGFPVKANYAGKDKNKRWFFSKHGGGNKISRSFEIDLSSKYPGQKIVIGSYKEFVRVDFHNADVDAFGHSVGMLGEFASGKTLARDGVTELNDYTKLGHEWQVIPEEDGMLFHNVSYPQYPEKCIDPESRAMKRRHRRLGESFITDEQAEAACAPIEDALDRKDCIYDVLVTQDLTMVGAY